MTCKTCRFLDVEPTKTGRIIVRKNEAFACNVKIPPPNVPACVVKVHGYSPDPIRSYMCGGDGEGCTFHETRQ